MLPQGPIYSTADFLSCTQLANSSKNTNTNGQWLIKTHFFSLSGVFPLSYRWDCKKKSRNCEDFKREKKPSSIKKHIWSFHFLLLVHCLFELLRPGDLYLMRRLRLQTVKCARIAVKSPQLPLQRSQRRARPSPSGTVQGSLSLSLSLG